METLSSCSCTVDGTFLHHNQVSQRSPTAAHSASPMDEDSLLTTSIHATHNLDPCLQQTHSQSSSYNFHTSVFSPSCTFLKPHTSSFAEFFPQCFKDTLHSVLRCQLWTVLSLVSHRFSERSCNKCVLLLKTRLLVVSSDNVYVSNICITAWFKEKKLLFWITENNCINKWPVWDAFTRGSTSLAVANITRTA